MKNKINSKYYFMLIGTTFLWGTLYVTSKYALDIIPSFTFMIIRYAITMGLCYLIFRNKLNFKIKKEDIKTIILLCVFGYFSAIAAQTIGTLMTNASISSLINSTNPIFIIVLAIPLLHERPSRPQIIAIFTALIGTIIIIGDMQGASLLIGVLISFVGVILWSLYSVFVRRLSDRYDGVVIIFWSTLISIICCSPFSIMEIINHEIKVNSINLTVISAILWASVMGTTVATILWNKSLEKVDAATCSLFYPIQPLSAAFLGIILLNEKLTSTFVVGSAIIIVSIIYAVLGNKKSTAISNH